MADKLDYKKEYKDLYMPPKTPVKILVPHMNFIMVDGRGDPSSHEYQAALAALYALSFTIKMSKLSGNQPSGYFEYVVPPLEGLWSAEGAFDFNKRDKWRWTSMIRQPEFVTQEVFERAKAEAARKKPDVDFSAARLASFEEGLCVQMMHMGPYSEEPETIEQMHAFIEQQGLINMTGDIRRHHEIYLGDPRKTVPYKLKTVLRLPVDTLENKS